MTPIDGTLEYCIGALGNGTAGDAELYYYLQHELGLRIPTVGVCPGHDAPWAMVRDSYFGGVEDWLAIADRGGGKTQNLAALEHCEMRFKHTGSVHVAATLDQADKCHEYVKSCFSGRRADLLVKDVARRTEIKPDHGGGHLLVATGSLKGVNAQHEVYLSVDEADLMDWLILQESFSIPVSSPDYQAAVRIITSWKKAAGVATKLQEEAEDLGLRVYRWCVFETMQQCRETSCARCEATISHDRLGRPHSFAERCQGKARRSRGYKPLTDVLKAFKRLDYAIWLAQWESLRPSSVGQYFQHYQPNIHEITEGSHDWEPLPRYGHYRFWDFGVADPNVCLFVQPYGEQLVVVDMIEDGDGDTVVMTAPSVLERSKKYGKCLGDWGDPAGMQRTNVGQGSCAIVELANGFGINVRPIPPAFNTHKHRHGVVESRLRLGPSGQPGLLVDTRTTGGKAFARHIASVRRPERDGIPYGEAPIEDEHFHSCSALQFGLVGVDTMGIKS